MVLERRHAKRDGMKMKKEQQMDRSNPKTVEGGENSLPNEDLSLHEDEREKVQKKSLDDQIAEAKQRFDSFSDMVRVTVKFRRSLSLSLY
jgi:hypothetical protein